eukprot:4223572-Prymnesium_polylepis.2
MAPEGAATITRWRTTCARLVGRWAEHRGGARPPGWGRGVGRVVYSGPPLYRWAGRRHAHACHVWRPLTSCRSARRRGWCPRAAGGRAARAPSRSPTRSPAPAPAPRGSAAVPPSACAPSLKKRAAPAAASPWPSPPWPSCAPSRAAPCSSPAHAPSRRPTCAPPPALTAPSASPRAPPSPPRSAGGRRPGAAAGQSRARGA